MIKKILFIDDEPWFIDIFLKPLAKAGYIVRTVNNAIDAIKIIDKFKPDALILDFFMPGPNAVVLLHELQSYEDSSKIPVILCTNTATDLPVDSLSHYGVVAILDKTTMQTDDILNEVVKI